MRLQMRGVDHDPLRLAALLRQFGEDLVEHPKPAPANEPIVDRLVRAIVARSIAPAQSVLDHKHDGADDPPIVRPARSRARAGNTAQSDASEPETAKTNQPWRSLPAPPMNQPIRRSARTLIGPDPSARLPSFSRRPIKFASSITSRAAASSICIASQRCRVGARSMTRKWRDAFASDRSQVAATSVDSRSFTLIRTPIRWARSISRRWREETRRSNPGSPCERAYRTVTAEFSNPRPDCASPQARSPPPRIRASGLRAAPAASASAPQRSA